MLVDPKVEEDRKLWKRGVHWSLDFSIKIVPLLTTRATVEGGTLWSHVSTIDSFSTGQTNVGNGEFFAKNSRARERFLIHISANPI